MHSHILAAGSIGVVLNTPTLKPVPSIYREDCDATGSLFFAMKKRLLALKMAREKSSQEDSGHETEEHARRS